MKLDDVRDAGKVQLLTGVVRVVQLTFRWVLLVLQQLMHSEQWPASLVGLLKECCGWLAGLLMSVLVLDQQHSSCRHATT